MYRSFFALIVAVIFIACNNGSDKQPDQNKISGMEKKPHYSLAQWSFNRDLFGGKMTNFDFIRNAGEMGFEGVEYVSQFFQDKAEDTVFLDSLNQQAKASGVKNLMIMVDNAGNLGASNIEERDSAIEIHKKWVLAAKYLGCSTIRVNAHGDGTDEQMARACEQSIGALADWAKPHGINIIIENHGGISNNGQWLAALLTKLAPHEVGALADPDNWCTKRENGQLWDAPCIESYDRYKGMEELMPFAKGLSVKTFEFDESGNETTMDYARIMDIIQKSNYSGYLAIEFEGHTMPSKEGILKTKALAEKHWKK